MSGQRLPLLPDPRGIGGHWRQLALSVLMLFSLACMADDTSVLGPGVISTAAVEYGAVIDPLDGTLYFVRTDSSWGKPGCGSILASTPDGSDWGEPVAFLAGGDTCYGDPFVSADGQSFLFTSNAHEDARRKDDDIWAMQRTRNGWSKPSRIEGVNSVAAEFSPVLTRSGTLYFASDRAGGLGAGDLWRAKRMGQHYAEPENLGPDINTEHGEWNLYVDPDETYLLFESSGRAGAQSPSGDLYRSMRRRAGWAAPRPLTTINTTQSELMPRPSSNGQQFYFTRSSPRGGADIMVVSASAVLGLHETPR